MEVRVGGEGNKGVVGRWLIGFLAGHDGSKVVVDWDRDKIVVDRERKKIVVARDKKKVDYDK